MLGVRGKLDRGRVEAASCADVRLAITSKDPIHDLREIILYQKDRSCNNCAQRTDHRYV
jgi:hypothetical protein